jgi:hypothetical protein
MTFEELVADIRKDAPGRVTVVSYEGLKFAMDCGINVWDYADTYSLQNVVRDFGTPKQKQRLKEELLARRWSEEIMLREANRMGDSQEILNKIVGTVLKYKPPKK